MKTSREICQIKIKPSEGDDLLLVNDVLQVDLGPVEGHLLDSLGCLAGVLEVNSEHQQLFKCQEHLRVNIFTKN